MDITRLIILLLLSLVLLAALTECRQRRPGRKRKSRPGLKRGPPKRNKLKNWFFRRGPRGKPHRENNEQESKKVYYYSVPRSTVRPRIILGDDLNFDDLGILDSPQNPSKQQFSPTSIPDDIDLAVSPSNRYNNNRHRKRPRGPGYRLKDSWNNHYVLEHESAPPQKHRGPPKVMTSVSRAAAEVRNAYKAAVIQSAKVARLTGHAASKYLQGVRGIFFSDLAGEERPTRPYKSQRARDDDEEHGGEATEVHATVLEAPTSSTKSPTLGEAVHDNSGEKLIPKVYLDWGGSFWKFFYNKSKVDRSETASER